MISDAITSLKERTGSSVPAIKKFIQEKYGNQIHDKNFDKTVWGVIKTFASNGKLVKVKGSYKLGEVRSPFCVHEVLGYSLPHPTWLMPLKSATELCLLCVQSSVAPRQLPWV